MGSSNRPSRITAFLKILVSSEVFSTLKFFSVPPSKFTFLASFSSSHLLILFSKTDVCEKQLDGIFPLGESPVHTNRSFCFNSYYLFEEVAEKV